MPSSDLTGLLLRLVTALERLAPPPLPRADLDAADAFVWEAAAQRLRPVPQVARVPLGAPPGHRPRARHPARQHRAASPTACRPTTRCSGARAAWARARWSRRSHAEVDARARRGAPDADRDPPRGHRHACRTCSAACAAQPRRFLLFCDDLSLRQRRYHYKSLKAVLEGGIEGRPDNVLFYATSNRRHLMPREMIENERSTAINPGEAVEEKVSLSDRFGLWLGFHTCSQDDYLAMVRGYAAPFRARDRADGAARRGARMGADPRRPLRPRGLAVRSGSARPRALATEGRDSVASAGNEFGTRAFAGGRAGQIRCVAADELPGSSPGADAKIRPSFPRPWRLVTDRERGGRLLLVAVQLFLAQDWHRRHAWRSAGRGRERARARGSLVMALDHSQGPALRVFLNVSTLLGVIGTGIAAYFLEAYVLVAFMALGVLGWFVHMIFGPSERGTGSAARAIRGRSDAHDASACARSAAAAVRDCQPRAGPELVRPSTAT